MSSVSDSLPTPPRADLVVPIVLVAADAEQRERIVCQLKAHIEALVASESSTPVTPTPGTDDVRVEHVPQRVTVGGEEVALSVREFRLLSALINRRNRAVSRDVLLREVWPGIPDEPTRRVDVMVTRLRDKLGTAGRLIQSVRGVGYCFVEMPPIGVEVDPNEYAAEPPLQIATGNAEAGPLKPQARPSVRMAC